MSEKQPPESLPRSARIKSQRDFVHVFEQGVYASDRGITLYGLINNKAESRLGISIGRRIGGAVQRNLIRRQIREVFRTIRHELPKGIDWVVIPKKGVEPTVSELQKSFRRLARQLEMSLANLKDRQG